MIIYNDGTYNSLMRKMWDEIFADEKEFADYYFDKVVARNKSIVNIEDGKLVGMLHLNPYLVNNNGKREKVYYIVGVAVEKNHRKQGIMKKMLNKALDDMKSWGCSFSFLMPEDERYYASSGFKKTIDCVTASYNIDELKQFSSVCDSIILEEIDEKSDIKSISSNIEELQNEAFDIYTICSEEYLEDLVLQHSSMNGKVVIIKLENRVSGYFAYDIYEDVLHIENLRVFNSAKYEVMKILYMCLDSVGYKSMKVTVDKSFYDSFMKLENEDDLTRCKVAHGYMTIDLNGKNCDLQEKMIVFDEIV